jgi:hypothetical protein
VKKVERELTADDQREINLWIEQRRLKFPSRSTTEQGNEKNVATRNIQNRAGELSELERKLRRKLSLIVSQMSPKDRKQSKWEKKKKRKEERIEGAGIEQTTQAIQAKGNT